VNLKRLAPLLPIPATFALGAAAAHAWLARAPHRFAVDLAQPLVVVTSWGAYGAGALAIFVATVVVAATALVLAIRSGARTAQAGDTAAIVAIATLAIGSAFAWPFVFSSDTYAYAAYGAMAASGLDPYAPLPGSAHGAFYEAARWQWSGPYPVCIYGPAFVGIASLVVRAAGAHGVAATLTALRLLAAGAFLGSIPLLDRALAGASRRLRYVALCAYGLNPICLWSVAEGHNDALLLCFVMAAAAIARRHAALGAFLLGLGPLLKAPGLALAGGAALEPRLRGPDPKRFAYALAAGLAVTCVFALPPLVRALGTLSGHRPPAPDLAAPIAGLALAAIVGAYALHRLRGGDPAGGAWLGIAVFFAIPHPYPWYALWLVPWCLGSDGPASRALWAATISSVTRYLPDVTGNLSPGIATIASVVAALPLGFALRDVLLGPRLKPPDSTQEKAPVSP